MMPPTPVESRVNFLLKKYSFGLTKLEKMI